MLNRCVLAIFVAFGASVRAEVLVSDPSVVGLSPMARRVLTRLDVTSMAEFAARYTAFEIRKNPKILFEVRKELFERVKAQGLEMRSEAPALNTATELGERILSAEAQTFLRRMGVTTARELAQRYTVRDLLADPRATFFVRTSDIQREIIGWALVEGFPLSSGAVARDISCAEADEALRRSPIMGRLKILNVRELALRHSIMSLMAIKGIGVRFAFNYADLAQTCGPSMSVTEAERKQRFAPDCAPNLISPRRK